jgi:hypothetical protein
VTRSPWTGELNAAAQAPAMTPLPSRDEPIVVPPVDSSRAIAIAEPTASQPPPQASPAPAPKRAPRPTVNRSKTEGPGTTSKKRKIDDGF